MVAASMTSRTRTRSSSNTGRRNRQGAVPNQSDGALNNNPEGERCNVKTTPSEEPPQAISPEILRMRAEARARELRARRETEARQRAARKAFEDCRDAYRDSEHFASRWGNVMPVDPITKSPYGIAVYLHCTGADEKGRARLLSAFERLAWRDLADRENCAAALLLDGQGENSLCLIDVDNPADDDGFVRAYLESKGIPLLARQETGREGGGIHYFFRRDPARWTEYKQHLSAKLFARTNTPVFERDESGAKRPRLTDAGLPVFHHHSQVDLKGYRAYAIAPGSIHKTGRRYRFTFDGQPVERLADVFERIPVLPLEVWNEMSRPLSVETLDAMEAFYGHTLPDAWLEHRGASELFQAKREGRTPRAPRVPSKHRDTSGADQPVTGMKPSTTGWTIKHWDHEHPAYAHFFALLGQTTADYPLEHGWATGNSACRVVRLDREGDGFSDITLVDYARNEIFTWKRSPASAPVSSKKRAAKGAANGAKAPRKKGVSKQVFPSAMLGRFGAAPEGLPYQRFGAELDARGYLPRDLLERVRERFPRARAVVLQARCGTGKTQIAADLFRGLRDDERGVVLAPTRTLVHDSAPRYGVRTHDEPDVPPVIEGSIAICGPSLHRISPAVPIELFVADEIEQVLAQYHGMTTYERGRRDRFELIACIRRSRFSLLMDAGAGERTVALLEDCCGAEPDALRPDEIVWVSVASEEKLTFRAIGTASAGLELVMDALLEGRRLAIAAMSAEFANALGPMVAEAFPALRLTLVTAETVEDGLSLRDINAIARETDVLIYSPVMSTGVSIDVKNHFDQVILFSVDGAADGLTAMQMVSRVRHPRSREVLVTGQNRQRPDAQRFDADWWLRHWRTEYALNRNYLGADFEFTPSVTVDPGSRIHLRAAAVHASAAARNGQQWVLRALVGDAQVNDLAELDAPPTDTQKLLSKALTEVKQRRKRVKAQAVAAVDPADLAHANLEAPTTRRETKKAAALAKALGPAYELADAPTREELAFEDSNGRVREQVYLYATVLLLALDEGWAVRLRDIREVESRADDGLRNRVAASEIVLRVLRSVGIEPLRFEDVTLDPSRINETVQGIAAENGGILPHALNLPRNWCEDPGAWEIQWIRNLLGRYGLKIPKGTRKRAPKAQGGGVLPREYVVPAVRLEEMYRRCRHQMTLLIKAESRYEPGTYANNREDCNFEELDRSFFRKQALLLRAQEIRDRAERARITAAIQAATSQDSSDWERFELEATAEIESVNEQRALNQAYTRAKYGPPIL